MIDLNSALPDLRRDMNIEGPGAANLTVQRSMTAFRDFAVFTIGINTVVTISGLTMANGRNPGLGDAGGIKNFGTLTIVDSVLRDNISTSGPGGIDNLGTLTIDNSTVRNNQGTFAGGIENSSDSRLTVRNNAIISDNQADSGGGIKNFGLAEVVNSTIRNNRARFSGGGISHVAGTLIVRNNSIISGNTAALFGGGINSFGIVEVNRSTVSGNTAGSQGGGIAHHDTASTLTVTNSTVIIGNTAQRGGGIYVGGVVNIIRSTLTLNAADTGGGVFTAGTLTINASTLALNAAGSGGGISNSGTLTAINSTISGNIALAGAGIQTNAGGRSFLRSVTDVFNLGAGKGPSKSRGAGILTESGGVTTAINTIVAGNSADSAPDVSGPLDSQGHNLIGDGTGGSGYTDTDLVGTSFQPIDPLLEPLGDYGGPTETHPPQSGSPVINAGDNSAAPSTDQRGFDRIVTCLIDIGAVEDQIGQRIPSATTLTSSLNPSFLSQAVTFTATVSGVPPTCGTPTGTVSFYADGDFLGSATLMNGMATFTTSSLLVGSHPITAEYSGDGVFESSSSPELLQVVNANPTVTTLTSSPNPSLDGQAVTFTAMVAPSGTPLNGPPTGTVSFYADGDFLGSAILVNGVAIFTTSALSVGSHPITAEYSGDGVFEGSTSLELWQVVNPELP